MTALEEYRCGECGAALAHPAEKHTIVDCGYEWKRRAEKAEAAIADVIAERENRLKAAEAMSADAWRQVRIARDRAERAEAHADAADAEHQRREDVLHEKLRQAEAENERLRVCGTCWWCSTYGDGCNCEENAEELSVSVEHGCSYTPPRWTPYWEEP